MCASGRGAHPKLACLHPSLSGMACTRCPAARRLTELLKEVRFLGGVDIRLAMVNGKSREETFRGGGYIYPQQCMFKYF